MAELIIPNIDYKKWLDNSKGGTSTMVKDMPSDSSFRKQLGRIVKALPDGDALKATIEGNKEEVSMDSIRDHAKSIAKNIKSDDSESNKIYESIFAAIQLWGGSGGRAPFVKKPNIPNWSYEQGKTVFSTPQYWIDTYKKGVSQVKQGKFLDAVKTLNSIKTIDTPFSTKHVWFWSEYFKETGSDMESQPIFDNQISRLIYGSFTDADNSEEVKKIYKKIIEDEKLTGWTIHDVEQSLFSFISAYYNNGITKFRKPEEDLFNDSRIPKGSDGGPLDFDEAKKILTIREPKEGESSGGSRFRRKSKQEPVEEPKSYDLSISNMDDNNISFNDDEDEVYNYEKNLTRYANNPSSSFLSDLKDKLDKVDPASLNDKWKEMQRLLKEGSVKKNIIQESWNKWSKWATK